MIKELRLSGARVEAGINEKRKKKIIKKGLTAP